MRKKMNIYIKELALKSALKLLLLSVVLFASLTAELWGQTCSCAGAPVFNPLEYTTMDKDKHWHFQLTYKYHAINSLVEGTKEITDDTDRTRTAQSIFFETRYKLSRRLSVAALLNFTGHSREVGISGSGGVNTQGLGDSMLSIRYSPLNYSDGKSLEFSVGGGLKMPTGRDNVQLIGVAAEDMQPGTGSWDVVVWGYGSGKVSGFNDLELFAGASFRFNGANDRDYRFGREIISAFGARFFTPGLLDFGLYGRYRWADSDERFAGEVPNTGGQWVYLVPSFTIKAGKNFGVKTEIEIPVYRKLNGFRQFTSTFLLSLSLYYEI
jgi:hypothetical protein